MTVQQRPIVEANGYVTIDLLCGGGGISTAMFLEGYEVASVLNHEEVAIASHGINYPWVKHFRADVRQQHAGALGLADWVHMSPDCRDHSRAKGGKPVSPSVRALPHEAPRYLLAANATVATFENVPEFVEWGPEVEVALPDGNTGWVKDKARKGEFYQQWVATIKAMGYVNHEHRILDSADYGSPQSRRRYIGIFSRAGVPIVWPAKTHDKHGRGGLPRWRGAREVLEPGNYGESVFSKSYVEATLNRLAEGTERFGEQAMPWFLKYNSNSPSGKFNPGIPGWKPISTLACQRREAVVRPIMLCPYYKSGKATSVLRPVQTVTTKDRFMLASAAVPVPGFTFSHQFGNGARPMGQPLRTMLASRRHQYIGFFHYWGTKPQQSSLDRPLPTVVTNTHTRVLSALYAPGAPGEKVMDHPDDSPAMRRLKAACRRHGIVDLLVRMLTVRESLRAQGFPEWYTLLGTETAKRKMIGNAVEVNTGRAVARGVKVMLDRHKASGRRLLKLKLRPVLLWEQGELFQREVHSG